MEPGDALRRRVPTGDLSALREIVPPRAVLTELARGFLLANAGDPEKARQFASTFLKEQAGRPSPGRIVPINRRPTVRRRVGETPGGPSDPYSVSSGYVTDPANEFGL